jgi:hypothetical protein
MSAKLAIVPQTKRPPRAGLVAHRSILDVPGFHFSPTGLKIDDWVEFEVWEQVGRALQTANQAMQWYVGDWLTHGERKWGEKYAQVVDAHKKTGIPIKTLRDYQFVAEKVPFAVRTANVEWSIHRAVAGESPARQKALLEKAAADRDKWTFRAMRRYIETGLEPGETSDIDAAALALASVNTELPAEDVKAISDRAMINFLLEALTAVSGLTQKCPRPKFSSDVLGSWTDEINDHLEQLSLGAIKDKVIKAWKSGRREESQLASVIGIPSKDVHGVMMAYKREGIFEKVERAKTKMGKGTKPWIWHLVGEPTGTDAHGREFKRSFKKDSNSDDSGERE